MLTIAAQFGRDMDQIVAFVDLTRSTQDLAKQDPRAFRSTHPLATAARDVHQKARRLTLPTVVAYDGAFLGACAQFELCVRRLIEGFLVQATTKLPDYSHLPQAIREWHPRGCANILVRLKSDKFKHLTADDIVKALASCFNSSPTSPYRLQPEAFSDNDRNFKPAVIEEQFDHIGVKDIWQKLSRQPDLRTFLGTHSEASTMQYGKIRLSEMMDRRNDIIHRGASYYTPGESEVTQCALYFKALISSLASVMNAYLASL